MAIRRAAHVGCGRASEFPSRELVMNRAQAPREGRKPIDGEQHFMYVAAIRHLVAKPPGPNSGGSVGQAFASRRQNRMSAAIS